MSNRVGCRRASIARTAALLIAAAFLPCAGAATPAPSSKGAIAVSSQPSQAEIILDGVNTGLTTFARLEDIDTGVHVLEVSVPNYLFARRRIRVLPDTLVTVSFQLISALDTAYVIGEPAIGVLSLEKPPAVSPPYVVDGLAVRSLQIALNEGTHRVQWDGRDLYASLDTVVEVFRGKVTYCAFSPRRLTGILAISPYPTDAEVVVDARSYGYGVFTRLMPSGPVRVEVRRLGYYADARVVNIAPNRRVDLDVELRPIPDRDGDGFLDSADHCPEQYGLYAGCPKPRMRDAVWQNLRRLSGNMRDDPLTISCNTLGYMYRMPTNKRFGEILSYFSDGKPLMNNVAGFVAGNMVAVSFRGFAACWQLGQWNTPLEYRKRDTLTIVTTQDSYHVYYDSLAGVEPIGLIPSTAFSLGVHYTFRWLDVGYTLGRQWEDIILADLIRSSDGRTTTVVFDNDWWFHQLHIDANIDIGASVLPSAYLAMKFPFGSHHRTGWHAFELGMKLKFRPKGRKSNDARTEGGG